MARPYLELGASVPTSPSKYVTLGGKVNRSKSQNRPIKVSNSKIEIPNRNTVQVRSPQRVQASPFKNSTNMQPVVMMRQRPAPVQVSRSPSPQRVIINNRLVAPSPQRKAPVVHLRYESAVGTFRPYPSASSVRSQPVTDLVIQEEKSMDKLKATYEQ